MLATGLAWSVLSGSPTDAAQTPGLRLAVDGEWGPVLELPPLPFVANPPAGGLDPARILVAPPPPQVPNEPALPGPSTVLGGLLQPLNEVETQVTVRVGGSRLFDLKRPSSG